MRLETCLQKKLVNTMQNIASGIARTLENLAVSLSEVRRDVELERDTRTKLEASIATAIKTALSSVAKAASHEVSQCLDRTRHFDVEMRSLIESTRVAFKNQCSRLEEALVSRIAEHENDTKNLRNEMKHKTHVLLGQIVREKDETASCIGRASSHVRQQLSTCKIQCFARGLTDAATLCAVSRLKLERQSAESQRLGERVVDKVDSLDANILAGFARIGAMSAASTAKENARAAGVEADLRCKHDAFEVARTLADVVADVVEAQQSHTLKLFTQGHIAKFAAYEKAAEAKLLSLDARLSAGIAHVADWTTSTINNWHRVHQDATEKLSAQIQHSAHDFHRVEKTSESQSSMACLMTTDLAVRIESCNILQSLMSTVVDRERQSQIVQTNSAIQKLNIKLKASDDMSNKLAKRLLLAESAVSNVINMSEWNTALQCAVGAFRKTCDSSSPAVALGVKSVFPRTIAFQNESALCIDLTRA
mmetsp:Transcript_14057/g.42267  ORF Transcript_14057/g.42267 Transcript_14057/m.42267 type:complete len:479 (+) Transcript_14057:1003-2439(+)